MKIGKCLTSTGKTGRVPLRIINLGNSYLKIFAHTNVAELEEIKNDDFYEPEEMHEKKNYQTM